MLSVMLSGPIELTEFFFLFFKAEFKARGEWCKLGDEHPPSIYYHKDYLQCASAGSFGLSVSTSLVAVLLLIVR